MEIIKGVSPYEKYKPLIVTKCPKCKKGILTLTEHDCGRQFGICCPKCNYIVATNMIIIDMNGICFGASIGNGL